VPSVRNVRERRKIKSEESDSRDEEEEKDKKSKKGFRSGNGCLPHLRVKVGKHEEEGVAESGATDGAFVDEWMLEDDMAGEAGPRERVRPRHW